MPARPLTPPQVPASLSLAIHSPAGRAVIGQEVVRDRAEPVGPAAGAEQLRQLRYGQHAPCWVACTMDG